MTFIVAVGLIFFGCDVNGPAKPEPEKEKIEHVHEGKTSLDTTECEEDPHMDTVVTCDVSKCDTVVVAQGCLDHNLPDDTTGD